MAKKEEIKEKHAVVVIYDSKKQAEETAKYIWDADEFAHNITVIPFIKLKKVL